jgi:hypothetical protein
MDGREAGVKAVLSPATGVEISHFPGVLRLASS